MCGIAGILTSRDRDADSLRRAVTGMMDSLRHRGPDADGQFTDAGAGVALGHRRLSIVDLSPMGAQPMRSQSGRFCLVLNGEIYNHLELRGALQAHGASFRGHSDTEVLLLAIEQWGLTQALTRAAGMFALALWDAGERKLSLARDRVGEKPLYCGVVDGVFLFASELRAFHSWPGFGARIDRTALAAYLRYLCVPSEFAIFEGCWKLAPASILVVRQRDGRLEFDKPVRYWDLESEAERAFARRREHRQEDAEAAFIQALARASARCGVADVPTGAFLSGGVDSASIVACLAKDAGVPPLTFSMGVADESLDEAPRARAIAAVLGTRHREEYVTEADALAVVPELGQIYDEPFADSSQIPTVLVSRLARRHVTVVLAGDGGDELLGGYPKYRTLPGRWAAWSRVPRLLRRGGRRVAREIGGRSGPGESRFLMEKVEGFFGADSLLDLADHSMTQWRFPERVVPGARQVRSWAGRPVAEGTQASLMINDLRGYFVDDLLVKVDRASMSTSLEVRLPFLDPDVMRAAWALPTVGDAPGATKAPLRHLLERHLPKDLVYGPKKGFSVPLGRWLRGPLREWASDLLRNSQLVGEEFLSARAIALEWEALDRRPQFAHRIWAILCAESWFRAMKVDRAAAVGRGDTARAASPHLV